MSRQDRLAALADHLSATAERPVERDASRWLGEAEAVARDAARADFDDDTLRERLGEVRHLLSNVESTGDEEADEHVAAAKELVAALLTELDEE